MGLLENIKNFPESSGVYLMHDSSDTIIYVGKAKNLKKRVSQYFLKNRDSKTTVLVSKIVSIEYILTNNEYDALLLENNLIKQHKPKYNISLKDGKTYPVIRVTAEKFPRIFKTRTIVNDSSLYFGPYPDVELIDVYIEFIKKNFKIRRCPGSLKKSDYPCLYYHIGVCSAPCIGKVTEDEYKKEIEKSIELINSDSNIIEEKIKTKIEEYSKIQNYEDAIIYRNFLYALKRLKEKQEIVSFDSLTLDYIAFYAEKDKIAFSVFQMKDGKLIGRDIFTFENYFNENFQEHFLINYYEKYHEPPQTIIFNSEIDVKYIEIYLSTLTVEPIKILKPESKRDWTIVNMIIENCKNELLKKGLTEKKLEGLKTLQQLFKLKKLPEIIEGFDIAHLGGKFTNASLVSFYNGKPNKKEYKHFKIKSLKVGEIDDFESMREVVARRYTRLKNENLQMPDLILIDGGLGQVNAVYEILQALELTSIFVVGLAKKDEELYLPNNSNPISLPVGDEGLKILQAVRDESHRFATTFRAKLENKEIK